MNESRLLLGGGLLFVVLWSSGYVSAAFAMEGNAPFTVALMRFVGTFALIGGFVFFYRPATQVRWSAWKHGMMAGVLLQAGFFGFTYAGMEIGVPPAAVGLIAGLMPLVTTLGGVVFLGEGITRYSLQGLVLGLVGVAFVIVPDLDAPGTVLGYFLVFLALLAFSAGTLYQKRWGGQLDPAVSLLAQVFAGALILVPLAGFFERFDFEASLESVGGVAWIILVNSCCGLMLYLWLISKGAAGRVSSLFYLVPPVTALMAAVFLGARLTQLDLIGFALASAGVWWGQRVSPAALREFKVSDQE